VARFCLDVSRLPRGEPFVLILGHLISYEHMGIARVTCVDDCACEPVEIDGHVPGGRFSVFKAMMITATRRAERTGSATHSAVTSAADCGCTVEVRIRMRQPFLGTATEYGRNRECRRVPLMGADCLPHQVRILEKTMSGEHKFKVLSLMTALKDRSLRYGHQAGFNNRPTEARFA
jgi:hypothetical protein